MSLSTFSVQAVVKMTPMICHHIMTSSRNWMFIGPHHHLFWITLLSDSENDKNKII